MKVLTFSRHFPKGHPKAGQPTYFVEQVLNAILPRPLTISLSEFPTAARDYINDFFVIDGALKKHHTIRAGNHWKAGDMASLRVWSDKPYRSKQIEFAQVEVKKVWEINIHIVGSDIIWQMPGCGSGGFNNLSESLKVVAKNDGLEVDDFINWFAIHPKKKESKFSGQIITWSDKVNYR